MKSPRIIDFFFAKNKGFRSYGSQEIERSKHSVSLSKWSTLRNKIFFVGVSYILKLLICNSFFLFRAGRRSTMQKIVFSPFPGPSLSRVCVEFFQACTNNTARPPSPSSHPSQSVLTSVRQSVSGSRKSESKREEKGGGGGGDELLYYLLLTMGQQAMGQGRRRRKEVAYGRKDGFNAYGHTRSGVIFCTAWIRLLSMAGRIGMLMRSFAEFIFQFRYSKFHLQTIFPRSSEISGFWWRWSSQSPRIPDRCNEISLL